MLHFSASVGRRAAPSPRVHRPTNSPSPTFGDSSQEVLVYQPWQDITESGDDEDDVATQEQLTLSPNDTCGFTQQTQDSHQNAIPTQRISNSRPSRVSDVSENPDVPINLDDRNSSRSDGSGQETSDAQAGAEISQEVARRTTESRALPKKVSCTPSFMLRQKRMIVQEAYAEPK